MASNTNVFICKWKLFRFSYIQGVHLVLVHGFHVGGNSIVFTDIISDKRGWLYH